MATNSNQVIQASTALLLKSYPGAKKAIAQLKTEAKLGGASAYRRVVLAYQLMHDEEWLKSAYNNDEKAARSFLGANYLGDLLMASSLPKLFIVLQEFPTLKDWEKNKFDLKLMFAKIQMRDKQPRNGVRWSRTKEEWEAQQAELAALKTELAACKAELTTCKAELATCKRKRSRAA